MTFGWNLFQSLQIRSNSQSANEGRIKSRENTADIASLEEKIDALSLACHAMWEILQQKHGVTLTELESKIQELDLRDGKLDGKLDLRVKNCPDCGHKLSSRHRNCFYCGAPIPGGGVFY
ncbi:MAG: zinc ribbon domain-containing protein [Pseudomonadota bacterium]